MNTTTMEDFLGTETAERFVRKSPEMLVLLKRAHSVLLDLEMHQDVEMCVIAEVSMDLDCLLYGTDGIFPPESTEEF